MIEDADARIPSAMAGCASVDAKNTGAGAASTSEQQEPAPILRRCNIQLLRHNVSMPARLRDDRHGAARQAQRPRLRHARYGRQPLREPKWVGGPSF